MNTTSQALSATQLSRMSDELIAADIVLMERLIHGTDANPIVDQVLALRYSQLVQERHVRTLARGRIQERRLRRVNVILEELAALAPGHAERDGGCALVVDDVVYDDENDILGFTATKISTWIPGKESEYNLGVVR